MGRLCNAWPRSLIYWNVRTEDMAAIAQLGERQTEDLKVPGSIPGLGILSSCFSELKAPCGDRTHDHTLTKRMLCQLSYGGYIAPFGKFIIPFFKR